MGRSTFSGPVKSKAGYELNDDADVVIEASQISGGSNSLDITTAQTVEASASTPDSRLKIKINGVEYYLVLESV